MESTVSLRNSVRLASAIVALLVCTVVPAVTGCGSGDPFDYVQVSGTVTYEDGTPIPAESMRLTFYPQCPPIDGRMYPRPGQGMVNTTDGSFSEMTSYTPGDGLVEGRHRVTVSAGDGSPLSAKLVPPEYGNFNKTPLQVDTAEEPFELKVRRP